MSLRCWCYHWQRKLNKCLSGKEYAHWKIKSTITFPLFLSVTQIFIVEFNPLFSRRWCKNIIKTKMVWLPTSLMLVRFPPTQHPSYCWAGCPSLPHTVQTCNSCTNRPDVCQCLVGQTPMDNRSKHAKNLRGPRSLRTIATFNCEAIHAQETGWQSGMRSYYYARTAHIFGAGIKYWQCRCSSRLVAPAQRKEACASLSVQLLVRPFALPLWQTNFYTNKNACEEKWTNCWRQRSKSSRVPSADANVNDARTSYTFVLRI